MDDLYHDVYCKKHDQWYSDTLLDCPICLGEEMGPAYLDIPKVVVFSIPRGGKHNPWKEAADKFGPGPRPKWFPETHLRNESIMW